MPIELRRRAAIVVAHPDDEVIFFGALAARLVDEGWDVDVICVTGQFGSPWATGTRRAEFSRACWALGVKARMLCLPDERGPLDEAVLAGVLAERVRWDQYARVYTHGPWGEYGHLHHVQVCRATHRCSRAVLSLAGPFAPDVTASLSLAELDRKRRLAARSYPSQPFAGRWCAGTEHLVVLSLDAVEFLAAIALSVGTGDDAAPQALPGLSADALPALVPMAVRSEAPMFPGVTHVPGGLWRDGHRARVYALQRWLTNADVKP
jgi:LmbE family N-acetylglucosaminyl deacetylase